MHTTPDMVVQFLLKIVLTVWVALLVYNVISALFGIDRLRRWYVDLLRMLYAVSCVCTR